MRTQATTRHTKEYRLSRFHLTIVLATSVTFFCPLESSSFCLAQRDDPRVDEYGDPLPPKAIHRLGTLRYRHHDRLTAFALSPDGKIAATGGNGRISVFVTNTGKQRLISQGSNSHDSIEKLREEFDC